MCTHPVHKITVSQYTVFYWSCFTQTTATYLVVHSQHYCTYQWLTRKSSHIKVNLILSHFSWLCLNRCMHLLLLMNWFDELIQPCGSCVQLYPHETSWQESMSSRLAEITHEISTITSEMKSSTTVQLQPNLLSNNHRQYSPVRQQQHRRISRSRGSVGEKREWSKLISFDKLLAKQQKAKTKRLSKMTMIPPSQLSTSSRDTSVFVSVSSIEQPPPSIERQTTLPTIDEDCSYTSGCNSSLLWCCLHEQLDRLLFSSFTSTKIQ